jgi:hypothetical protein
LIKRATKPAAGSASWLAADQDIMIDDERTGSADQMAQQIKGETEKFAKLVKDAKVTIE